jgi:hypothetical protein
MSLKQRLVKAIVSHPQNYDLLGFGIVIVAIPSIGRKYHHKEAERQYY